MHKTDMYVGLVVLNSHPGSCITVNVFHLQQISSGPVSSSDSDNHLVSQSTFYLCENILVECSSAPAPASIGF